MGRLSSATAVFVALLLLATTSTALEDFNATDSYFKILYKNGEEVFITEDLMRKLSEESETWHWTPWLRTRTEVYNNIVREVDCTESSSVDSFPDSIFTEDQLRSGAFLLYVVFGIYTFTLLAIVCNDFFIPCVELICEDLKIPQNVAAATFMAVATSCPEFFVNVISTFLTMSDMGIGTIVGSAIFNLLGVATVGGLAAIVPIKIEARPVTRDVIIYMINVGVLVSIVWDGQVEWYEAMVLAILYVLYFVVMFNSIRIFNLIDKIVGRCCPKLLQMSMDTDDKITEDGIDNKGFNNEGTANGINNNEKMPVTDIDEVEEKPKDSIFRFPMKSSLWYKLWWLYKWPINFVFYFTIPSPVTCRRFYPLSFLMCIVWIGVNSYFVSWSMSVIGNTFFIPDSVMGMTFLAFGGCLPEACSIFIMSRRGEGGIGVSNALGGNSLAILFALGLPWLIKTVTLTVQGAEDPVVYINSAGIDFVVGSLMLAASLLWLTLFIGKFKLRKALGLVFFILYACFISFAILVELGIILDRGIEFC